MTEPVHTISPVAVGNDPSLRRLVPAALVLSVLICALMAYWLWVLRDHRLQFVTRQVFQQTSAVREHAGIVFKAVDASLLDTVADLSDGRLEPATAHRSLRLRLSGGPHVRALSLADAEGRVLASSWSDPPPPVKAASFKGDTPLRVSAPAASPYDGREAIELARSVPGGAAGVAQVIAVVDNQFVTNFYSRVAAAPGARVGLYALDGTRLVGNLDLAALAGHATPGPAVLDDLLAASRGGAVPREQTFAAAQRLDGLPMVVVSAHDRSGVMGPWREYVAGALAATVLGLTLLGAMVLRLRREMISRLQAQVALEQSRERTRLAFEAAQEGVWSWDIERGMLALSPRMAELLGVQAMDLPKDFFRGEHIHHDDRGLVEQALATHVPGHSPQLTAQFRVARPEGGWRWIHVRGRALRDAGGTVVSVVGTASDESEARARAEQLQDLQAKLQRTRRLESLGRLAGGIAHDFNNILGAVVGYGELLREAVADGSRAAVHAEGVLRAGERGHHLVDRILAFSRGGAGAHMPMRIEPVVSEALDLLSASLHPQVRLECELHGPDAVILGDATQLFEVISNLCTNALHAMPDGGTLQVRVEPMHSELVRALSHGTLEAGRFACITVADDGVGMDADVLEHLFEPFFTTRAPQTGTGLGLAMVHGAVKEMGGAIDVESAPGRGTRFTLYFPLIDADMDAAPAGAEAWPHGAGQVVMVVDDEPALVALAEETLAALGYEGVGCRDPREALSLMRESPGRFDAMLTDQIMPGMTGTELARRVRELRPDLPVLLTTGFGGTNLERLAAEAGVAAVLRKPLRRGDLAAHLARVLAPSA